MQVVIILAVKATISLQNCLNKLSGAYVLSLKLKTFYTERSVNVNILPQAHSK